MLYGTLMPHHHCDISNMWYRPQILGFLTFYILVHMDIVVWFSGLILFMYNNNMLTYAFCKYIMNPYYILGTRDTDPLLFLLSSLLLFVSDFGTTVIVPII